MGIERQRGLHIFRCDVCDAERTEKIVENWDVSRMSFTEAEEAGWEFDKVRGAWIALCPDHADHGPKTF